MHYEGNTRSSSISWIPPNGRPRVWVVLVNFEHDDTPVAQRATPLVRPALFIVSRVFACTECVWIRLCRQFSLGKVTKYSICNVQRSNVQVLGPRRTRDVVVKKRISAVEHTLIQFAEDLPCVRWAAHNHDQASCIVVKYGQYFGRLHWWKPMSRLP